MTTTTTNETSLPAVTERVLRVLLPSEIPSEFSPDETRKLRAHAERLVAGIEDDASANAAADFSAKTLRPLADRVSAFWSPFKSLANSIAGAIRSREAEPLDDISAADRVIVDGLREYRRQVKLAKEADRARQAAAAKAEQEAAAKREAAALEAAGRPEQAAAVIEEAASAPPPVPAPAPLAKPSGLATVEKWRVPDFKATDGIGWDVKALCRAIADGKVPTDAVSPNMSVINKAAQAMKATFNWPGVPAAIESEEFRRTGR